MEMQITKTWLITSIFREWSNNDGLINQKSQMKK